MKNRIIISITVLVSLGIAGYWYWLLPSPDSIKMFPTQEECEKKTGGSCRNDVMCDYNCPRDFHKGWWTPSSIEQGCAQEGQTIGAQGIPEQCCKGLQPMSGHGGGYTGECNMPPAPGGLSICSACGNNLCEEGNGENKCNCALDCK